MAAFHVVILLSLLCTLTQANSFNDWLDAGLPSQDSNINSNFAKCYTLPYGGIGFLTNVLVTYNALMILGRRSPLLFQQNTHWRWNLLLTTICLIWTLGCSILTMYRCRKYWEMILLATWQACTSLSLCIAAIHSALVTQSMLPRIIQMRLSRRVHYAREALKSQKDALPASNANLLDVEMRSIDPASVTNRANQAFYDPNRPRPFRPQTRIVAEDEPIQLPTPVPPPRAARQKDHAPIRPHVTAKLDAQDQAVLQSIRLHRAKPGVFHPNPNHLQYKTDHVLHLYGFFSLSMVVGLVGLSGLIYHGLLDSKSSDWLFGYYIAFGAFAVCFGWTVVMSSNNSYGKYSKLIGFATVLSVFLTLTMPYMAPWYMGIVAGSLAGVPVGLGDRVVYWTFFVAINLPLLFW